MAEKYEEWDILPSVVQDRILYLENAIDDLVVWMRDNAVHNWDCKISPRHECDCGLHNLIRTYGEKEPESK